MISVNIEYYPYWSLRKKRLIRASFPSSWRELTAEQLCVVRDVSNNSIPEEKVLQIFLGIRKRLVSALSAWQRFNILRCLYFLDKVEAVESFIIPRLGRFVAPKPRLAGVTFGQFVFADTYYFSYIQGAKDDLNRLIASFYLDGTFDEYKIEANAKIISSFPLKTREAIALNYSLIREWLAQQYIYVFEKPDDEEMAKNQGKKRQAEWVKIFDNVVGDDVVNADLYAKMELSTAMRYMDRKIKELYKHG